MCLLIFVCRFERNEKRNGQGLSVRYGCVLFCDNQGFILISFRGGGFGVLLKWLDFVGGG